MQQVIRLYTRANPTERSTMKSPTNTLSLFASVALLSLGFSAAQAPNAPQSMSFFVTSVGSGKGADLGGLTGADAHCQSLAAAVGAGARTTWHAYLSAQTDAGAPAINARDRISERPWYNAKATLIARDLDELHGTNMLTKQTALTEKGAVVNGRGDTPNMHDMHDMHDMLTGSQPDGKAFPPDKDMTCRNLTSSSDGTAMLGHSDRAGTTDDPRGRSWNSSHPSRGCSQDGLKSTGGAGLFYCFATN
jgi:hypothetical protein